MEMQCIICCEYLSDPGDLCEPWEIYATICGHIFHYHCLAPWLRRSQSCPECRKNVSLDSVHRIYLDFNSHTDTVPIEELTILVNKCENLEGVVQNLKDQNNRLKTTCEKLETSKKEDRNVLESTIKRVSETMLSTQTELISQYEEILDKINATKDMNEIQVKSLRCQNESMKRSLQRFHSFTQQFIEVNEKYVPPNATVIHPNLFSNFRKYPDNVFEWVQQDFIICYDRTMQKNLTIHKENYNLKETARVMRFLIALPVLLMIPLIFMGLNGYWCDYKQKGMNIQMAELQNNNSQLQMALDECHVKDRILEFYMIQLLNVVVNSVSLLFYFCVLLLSIIYVVMKGVRLVLNTPQEVLVKSEYFFD